MGLQSVIKTLFAPRTVATVATMLSFPPAPPRPKPVMGDGSWELQRLGDIYVLIGHYKSLDMKRVVKETNEMAFELGRLAIPYEIVFPSDGSITYLIDPKHALKAALGLPGIKVSHPIEEPNVSVNISK